MQKVLQHTARSYLNVIAHIFAGQSMKARAVTAARGARHLGLGLRLNDATQLHKAHNLAEAIALAARVESVLPTVRRGVFFYQFELPPAHWQNYTRADVQGLAIGLAERRRPVQLDFTEPHTLIAGTTGSGKSETVKSALVALMKTTTPANLGLVIVDPNYDFEHFHRAAHLELPIAHDTADIERALQWIHGKLKHRKANNIRTGKRIVLVIDEAQDALANEAHLMAVQDVAEQARKYRINLVLSTQKPTARAFPDLLDKINNRFVGMVTDAKLSAMLTGHPGLNAHRLTGKGDFLHVLHAESTRFQVAMATQQDFNTLPRADVISPPPAARVDFSTLPPEPEAREPGRPPVDVEAHTLAYYLASIARGQDISVRGAGTAGITRTRHELHKPLAEQISQYLAKLNITLLPEVTE